MEGIMLALELAGYGLGGVFLSLILLYLLVRVLGSAVSNNSKKEK